MLIGGCYSAVTLNGALTKYSGYVVDEETKEPVKDVVVFIDFIAPNSFLAEGRRTVDVTEGLTDENGFFSLSNKGWSFNPWQMLYTTNDFTIFKSGYLPISGSSWRQILHEFPSTYVWSTKELFYYIWKVENRRPFILLKNANPDREKRLSDFRSVYCSFSPEKVKLLDKECQKEYDILFPSRKN